MSIANLSHILNIFRGSDLNDEEESVLFAEVLLMTLARASSSDSNTHPIEVETVRKIVLAATGEEVSDADVRVASASELYESASLEKYLFGIDRVFLEKIPDRLPRSRPLLAGAVHFPARGNRAGLNRTTTLACPSHCIAR